jgi:hypothetical protein
LTRDGSASSRKFLAYLFGKKEEMAFSSKTLILEQRPELISRLPKLNRSNCR